MQGRATEIIKVPDILYYNIRESLKKNPAIKNSGKGKKIAS